MAPDEVSRPSHYVDGRGIDPIDFTAQCVRDLPGDEALHVGTVLKYLARYRRKHPEDPAQDLRKARQYLEWAIEAAERNGPEEGPEEEDEPQYVWRFMTGLPPRLDHQSRCLCGVAKSVCHDHGTCRDTPGSPCSRINR
ncbi:DUF3310 domain-containing protein [Marivibrio halodurans]|uniref:DUF3310 domain-containing protein n=1 Tax=Marivibrio halodurans TaxID=2039722 RepID=UPI00361C2B13